MFVTSSSSFQYTQSHYTFVKYARRCQWCFDLSSHICNDYDDVIIHFTALCATAKGLSGATFGIRLESRHETRMWSSAGSQLSLKNINYLLSRRVRWSDETKSCDEFDSLVIFQTIFFSLSSLRSRSTPISRFKLLRDGALAHNATRKSDDFSL